MRVWTALSLLLLAACMRSPSRGWSVREEPGLFQCELPINWNLKRQPAEEGLAYSDGEATIRVLFHDEKSPFPSIDAFVNSPAGAHNAMEDGSTDVARRRARLFHRRYQMSLGGPENDAGPSRWAYQAFALLPAGRGAGFWELRYWRLSPPVGKPHGLEVWSRFLQTFQPER